MLMDNIAYVMECSAPRTGEWLRKYLNSPWKGTVRLNGIIFAKRTILEAYIKEPMATVYVPWRRETITDKRIEFTTGRHSPLMFHALFHSYMKYGRFEEGLELLEMIPMNFLFGLSPTVGTGEINPVNAHFMEGRVHSREGEEMEIFRYYCEAKEELKLYYGMSQSSVYKSLAHIGALQKMASYSILADDLPAKILKKKPLAVHDWLIGNAE